MDFIVEELVGVTYRRWWGWFWGDFDLVVFWWVFF